MIRSSVLMGARFPVEMRHAEDLAFYLTLARRGQYRHVEEVVLHYRRGHGSAMGDLDGLAKGYAQLKSYAAKLSPPPEKVQLQKMQKRIAGILWRSYVKAGRPRKALSHLWSWIKHTDNE
jgi:hypothetical protein